MQKITTVLFTLSLKLTLFNKFCPPPPLLPFLLQDFFFNSGDMLSRGILIGFPFPLSLPFDAAVSLDLGLPLGSLLPPIIAFARSQASLSGHTEG